jgi:hypothetical protein
VINVIGGKTVCVGGEMACVVGCGSVVWKIEGYYSFKSDSNLKKKNIFVEFSSDFFDLCSKPIGISSPM